MYSRGNRVFYDKLTGRVLWQTGVITSATDPIEHEDIYGQITYADLKIDAYDPMKKYVVSVNPKTGKPIFKDYEF